MARQRPYPAQVRTFNDALYEFADRHGSSVLVEQVITVVDEIANQSRMDRLPAREKILDTAAERLEKIRLYLDKQGE